MPRTLSQRRHATPLLKFAQTAVGVVAVDQNCRQVAAPAAAVDAMPYSAQHAAASIGSVDGLEAWGHGEEIFECTIPRTESLST